MVSRAQRKGRSRKRSQRAGRSRRRSQVLRKQSRRRSQVSRKRVKRRNRPQRKAKRMKGGSVQVDLTEHVIEFSKKIQEAVQSNRIPATKDYNILIEDDHLSETGETALSSVINLLDLLDHYSAMVLHTELSDGRITVTHHQSDAHYQVRLQLYKLLHFFVKNHNKLGDRKQELIQALQKTQEWMRVKPGGTTEKLPTPLTDSWLTTLKA